MGVRSKRLSFVTIAAGSAALIATQVGFEAHATTPVTAGVASAGAALLGTSPEVSGLTLTSTFGEADAAYQEAETEAKSGRVDLGGLGYFVAGTNLCGHPGPSQKQQPQPLTADSENGASTQTNGTPGVGVEQVSVSPQPERASATTSAIDETLPGILQVTGQAHAVVNYIANSEQEADASVVEDVSLLGGLVELKGLSWSASRHAGARNQSSASFSLGSVSIAHVPVAPPGGSTTSILAAVNQVIGAFGFTLSPPGSSSEAFDGSVSMSPMVLRFSGSKIDRTLLGPSVSAVANLESALAAQAAPGTDCTKYRELIYNVGNNFNGLINLALAIGQGAGALDFDIGGATAGVKELPAFDNPFGSGAVPLPGPMTAPPVASSPASAPAGVALPPARTPVQPSPASAAPATTPAALPSGNRISVAGVVVCHTTSPAGNPGCWRGVAGWAAGATVFTGAAVLAADVIYGRRRPRRRRRDLA